MSIIFKIYSLQNTIQFMIHDLYRYSPLSVKYQFHLMILNKSYFLFLLPLSLAAEDGYISIAIRPSVNISIYSCSMSLFFFVCVRMLVFVCVLMCFFFISTRACNMQTFKTFNFYSFNSLIDQQEGIKLHHVVKVYKVNTIFNDFICQNYSHLYKSSCWLCLELNENEWNEINI